jgi:hypothetical protein
MKVWKISRRFCSQGDGLPMEPDGSKVNERQQKYSELIGVVQCSFAGRFPTNARAHRHKSSNTGALGWLGQPWEARQLQCHTREYSNNISLEFWNLNHRLILLWWIYLRSVIKRYRSAIDAFQIRWFYWVGNHFLTGCTDVSTKNLAL